MLLEIMDPVAVVSGGASGLGLAATRRCPGAVLGAAGQPQ